MSKLCELINREAWRAAVHGVANSQTTVRTGHGTTDWFQIGKGDPQRMKWLDGISNVMDMSWSRLWELVMDREGWHYAVHRVTKSWTQLEQLN